MNTIWKYPLALEDFQKIEMPAGAEVLTVQMQGDTPCLWARVDSEAPKGARGFWILGTGNPIENPTHVGRYIGTFQMHRGALVWHVFEHHYGPF